MKLRTLSLMMLVLYAAGAIACGASARQKAITGAYVTVSTAATALAAYNAPHENAILQQSPDKATWTARLATWRDQRAKLEQDIDAGYRMVAVAAGLNDDQSLASMVAAGKVIEDELTALGILGASGGGK